MVPPEVSLKETSWLTHGVYGTTNNSCPASRSFSCHGPKGGFLGNLDCSRYDDQKVHDIYPVKMHHII